jgi:ferric-dicitrate binding protein FerR (iron transport regulator)
VQVKSWGRESTLALGAPLQSGRRFEARGATLLELSGGGNVRVARDSRFEVLAANTIRLDSGEIYVDIPPGSRTGASLVAITSAGEFRHLGTQFALSVAGGATRLRVREGSVHWHAADGDATVAAGSEVLINRLHQVTRALVGASGAQWAWTETLAPEVNIEDRPVAEFLDWFARETGRHLVLADGKAQRDVNSIHMHGNVHGLEPGQALAAVLGSTSLRFQVSADAIRVSSPGDSPSQSQ